MTPFHISFLYDEKDVFRYIDIKFLLFLHKEEIDCTSKPAENGLCHAWTMRFYFDKYDNKCKRFKYGGCGGSNNNYKTQDECYLTCGRRGKLWFTVYYHFGLL